MSGILDTKVTLRHLLILGILVATFAVSVGTLAANTINGAFSAGSIRMSSAKSNQFLSVSGTDNPPVLVLHTAFTVPSGKTADVQATFAASLAHNVGTYAFCFGAFTLDGATTDANFKPGSVQLIGGGTATEPDTISTSMTGFRKGISHGSHTVNVYIHSAYAGCTVEDRALNVLVNIH